MMPMIKMMMMMIVMVMHACIWFFLFSFFLLFLGGRPREVKYNQTIKQTFSRLNVVGWNVFHG